MPVFIKAAKAFGRRDLVIIHAGLARTVFMEARSFYGPSIDVCASTTGCKPPLSVLASVLTDGKEFQVSIKAGAVFGLRLVPAALPRTRPLTSLKGVTSFVTGGTKVCCILLN